MLPLWPLALVMRTSNPAAPFCKRDGLLTASCALLSFVFVLMGNEDSCRMPTPLTPPTLEVVLQGLHEAEIRCEIQNNPPTGRISAWIDFGSRIEMATLFGTIVGNIPGREAH